MYRGEKWNGTSRETPAFFASVPACAAVRWRRSAASSASSSRNAVSMKSWSAPRANSVMLAIRCMESGVDHVDDSVSTRATQRVLLEHAEGDEAIVADENPAVVRRPAPDRSLGF